MHRQWTIAIVALLATMLAARDLLGGDNGIYPTTMPMMYVRQDRPVVVMGAVDRPGQYELGSRGGGVPLTMYLEELGISKLNLQRASVRVISGVVTSDARLRGATTRPTADAIYMLLPLLDGTLPDVELRGGELIVVNQDTTDPNACYIAGEGVKRPGAYQIATQRTLTIKQLIVSAGLQGDTAKMMVEHYSRTAEGTAKTTRYSLADVMDGNAQAIVVQRGDTVVVGASGNRK